ncbi:uncharacterized protein LOC126733791 [Anthonomus grandis grandis]|uniref:uncharacterized protein LOC126733791 n=1 Tax=Anthonomus grandis grandis TaxID=2921223 RepID=UPI002165E644|nr:uncharacterized protein LOC126733791 [Anthonomus grandis grandis]
MPAFDGKIISKKRNGKLLFQIKKTFSIINELELSYLDSQRYDRFLLLTLGMKTLHCSSLEGQLEEALKENKEVLSAVRIGSDDKNSGLCNSISTVSLVHLQYKYEELLTSHRGLLQVLELRNNEVKKYLSENRKLQEQIQRLSYELGAAQDTLNFLKRKITDFKRRKHQKIVRLKAEKHTLSLVHEKLVAMLHRQCMEKNSFVESLLKTTTKSEKALLLQEIKKNNTLTYENFQLQQEIQYLRNILNVSISRKPSKDTVKSLPIYR